MYLLQKLEAELTTEMEALETHYRGYLPSRLSGFYLTTFDYSTLSLPGTLKRFSTQIPHSTPNSPSSFSIPRVRLRTSGSDTSSLSSTLSRRYSKSDLVPSLPRSQSNFFSVYLCTLHLIRYLLFITHAFSVCLLEKYFRHRFFAFLHI